MAEAIARQMIGAETKFESAGIHAYEGASVTKEAIRAMKRRGIDIRGHRARPLDGLDLSCFDLIIALDRMIADELLYKGVDAAKLLSFDINDPYGKGFEAYLEADAAIDRELRKLFDHPESASPDEI